jgi:hypothetical protein
MLRTCSYLDCHTVTLSTYCLEHEREILATIEVERATTVADAPLTRERAALNPLPATALPELPTVEPA